MAEQRLQARALAPRARVPLGHAARLGGVEPEAEPVARLSVLRQHARDQRFLPGSQAQRVDVDER